MAARRAVLLSPFLAVAPPDVEAQYWSRFRAFDLINCLIPVLYFGKTLTAWFTPALLAVYASVLTLKLFHAYLLLHKPSACLRWRKPLLWVERVVRTLISVRVVAYGKQYKAWLDRSSHMYSLRVLLLNSGFTISCWNIFCLPLDFPSQVVLTAAFILSSLPGSLHEVCRVLSGFVERAPWLVRLYGGLRGVAHGAAALGAEALLRGTLASGGPISSPAAAAWGPPPGAQCPAASGGEAAAAAAAPGAGPQPCWASGGSGGTAAARSHGGGGDGGNTDATLLSAVLSCTYVLYICSVCPLWLAFHLERVFKQRWLQSHPGLAWVNAPPNSGAWPTVRRAASQLSVLFALTLAASEACVAMWDRLGLPVWLQV